MLTKEQCLKLYDEKFWENMNDDEIVNFQLFEERLCMPFDIFHGSVEKILKRPVFTHEFARPENLRKEFLGDKEPPTFDEILNIIPKDKRLLIIG